MIGFSCKYTHLSSYYNPKYEVICSDVNYKLSTPEESSGL